MKKIVFTVTNDLSYDQRMQRICTSLAANNYEVLLIGRKKTASLHLKQQNFHQKRLHCWFQKGPGFYLEYNLRLFFYLLFVKTDAICAIDLDTILPCYFISVIRNKPRIYDAHELFTEMKEIVERPAILKAWKRIEKFAVPKFKYGYTVNQSLADEFYRRYRVQYEVIRNLPHLNTEQGTRKGEEVTNDKKQETTYAKQGTENEKRVTSNDEETSNDIIYQGAVNEGRSFETLIPAMQQVNATLIICGEGNFFEQTKALIKQYKVEHKVELKGYVDPAELKKITPTAKVAVMIFESTGMNQYHSLSNRFFDYIMAGVPQICVNYPEYKTINDQYNIALMIDDTDAETIAGALNRLLTDNTLHEQLHLNCLKAREELNWSVEEKKLLDFYGDVFHAKMQRSK